MKNEGFLENYFKNLFIYSIYGNILHKKITNLKFEAFKLAMREKFGT